MNTNNEGMRLRCPDSRAIGKAKLMQHKFCFRYHADATACEGAVVEGVLWVISDNDLEQLDWIEGYPHYYERKQGLVIADTTILDAWFYTMKDRHPLEAPDTLYYETCQQGYKQHSVDTVQLENAMYFANTKVNTVGEAVALWKQHHGAADIRFYLDERFWSYVIDSKNKHNNLNEIETWCTEVLGQDNWCRVFEKFWFTSEQDYIMFKITWNRNDNHDGLSIRA